jgi:hypothetical protein
MPWTPPGRPAAPEPMPVERVIWTLVKAARSARAIERAHPLGRELRLLVASEFLWSRVIRPGDETTVEAEAARIALVARGWSPAE